MSRTTLARLTVALAGLTAILIALRSCAVSQTRAKRARAARDTLGLVVRAAVGAYEREPTCTGLVREVCRSEHPPDDCSPCERKSPHALCASAAPLPADDPAARADALATGDERTGWPCLRLRAPLAPPDVRFEYEARADGFEVRALGDFEEKDGLEVLRRSAQINAQTQTVRVSDE